MAKDPQAVAQKWATNLGAATQSITDGVNAVTVAPGQAAARQAAVWLQNLQAAQGKWKANVAAVSLSDWQSAMTTKGVQRIASGAQAAQSKFAAFQTQLLPYIENARSGLPARGNLEQNIARMTAFTRKMADFQYRKSS